MSSLADLAWYEYPGPTGPGVLGPPAAWEHGSAGCHTSSLWLTASARCRGDLGIKVTIKATSRCPSGLTSHA